MGETRRFRPFGSPRINRSDRPNADLRLGREQRGRSGRAPPDRPVVQAIALADRKVVDAGNAASHQAALVKLPILVAERPKPVAAAVMPLIGETYRDAVLA